MNHDSNNHSNNQNNSFQQILALVAANEHFGQGGNDDERKFEKEK